MTQMAKLTYQSSTLPEAPQRFTQTEAEADDTRGIELTTYLALLPHLTTEQWGIARQAARRATESAERNPIRRDARTAIKSAAQTSNRTAAHTAASTTTRNATRDIPSDAARRATRDAVSAAEAIVVRDIISNEHFTIITAPMRAAGINFDQLTPVNVEA
jgi:hypothetical protein